jgi:hypothetical protein
MTALSLATIPSAINTYERLAFWVAQCLQDTTNGLGVNVIQNQGSVPRCQVQLSKIADGTDTAIISLYIPINFDELNNASAKTWMAALDVATAAPNTVYLSN